MSSPGGVKVRVAVGDRWAGLFYIRTDRAHERGLRYSMAEKKELSKDDKIKKEMNKLKRIFKDIRKDRKSLCENLIKNAAFMSVTLEELQEDINNRGTVIVAHERSIVLGRFISI